MKMMMRTKLKSRKLQKQKMSLAVETKAERAKAVGVEEIATRIEDVDHLLRPTRRL